MGKKNGKLEKKFYEKELARLQGELIKLQEWVKAGGERIVVIFEGRDAAGKGGTIKRITQYLNPRVAHIVALGKPTDREVTQWYFQRYVKHLPAAGEICLFDRSWYNAAGVDRVMGFLTPQQVEEFLISCPDFENMLIRSGIRLIKFWLSISFEEQEKRLRSRLEDPLKRWKFSPMDLKSWERWEEYSQARDAMFAATHTEMSPWWVVESDDKKRVRLNTIAHLLSLVPYTDVPREKITLPPRPAPRRISGLKQAEPLRVPDRY
ncbi:MAG: polyphosphate kinase 2 [Spirochaetales bacterium]|nr:MAG: polyphosphate kinase 2 [Spirochaetales bacterium]